ncbi:MAG: tRNA (guanosine(46)-N7)-methyltransferase TrmB [Bacteroidetes bacterium]|nr:tRNA (guanosine(46)-N7)-methyltransferase TrmB [Bacteroidota bacterium]
MPKKKLLHFKENLTFPFLFQIRYHELNAPFPLRGSWNENFFGNSNPIILELGCGKGEYTVGLAKAYPDKNFIGIDVKGARLWSGCRSVTKERLGNVAFIRSQVDYIEYFFAGGEVSDIWITFPDPQPKKENHRLTSARFIDKFQKIMKPGGEIYLKTDDTDFYNFTLMVIKKHGFSSGFATDDLYHSGTDEDVIKFQTFYEQRWLGLGKKICYLRFSLQKNI